MVWLVFGFVALAMIGAGTLILKLAEISKADRGNKSWMWGVLILVALIIIPIFVLGIIIKMVQYSEMSGAFESFDR